MKVRMSLTGPAATIGAVVMVLATTVGCTPAGVALGKDALSAKVTSRQPSTTDPSTADPSTADSTSTTTTATSAVDSTTIAEDAFARSKKSAKTGTAPTTTSTSPTTTSTGLTTTATAPTTTGTGPTTTSTSPSPTPAYTPQVPANAVSADLKSYGAACDGVTNDRAALQRGILDMTAKHGTLTITGTCRILTTGNTAWITLNGAITIRGTSPSATLALDADQISAFRVLFNIYGDGVVLQNLILKRVVGVYGLMIGLHGTDGFVLDGVTIDGQKNVFPGNIFHGVAIWGDGGDVTNTTFNHTTIRNTDFALLQDSNVTTSTVGFVVENSTFTGNYMDDLEFNSPSGRMTGVKVTNSSFTNNRAPASQTGAGFGVGLANVQDALIQGNTFDGYMLDPVHIEDRSAAVTVDHNVFRNSFTSPLNFASQIFIVSGAHDITVTNNTFDTSANTNRIDCVYVGSGGGAQVRNVTVSGNSFMLRPNAQAVGIYGASNVIQSGSTTIDLP